MFIFFYYYKTAGLTSLSVSCRLFEHKEIRVDTEVVLSFNLARSFL